MRACSVDCALARLVCVAASAACVAVSVLLSDVTNDSRLPTRPNISSRSRMETVTMLLLLKSMRLSRISTPCTDMRLFCEAMLASKVDTVVAFGMCEEKVWGGVGGKVK